MHTPGPWTVVMDGQGYCNVHGADGAVVGCEGFYRCDGQDLANATLTAAAPTMHDAIRDALIGIGMARNAAMDGRTDEVLLHLGHHEARLQAAISKAESTN